MGKAASVASPDRSIARVRSRLTVWYTGTLAVILLLLGGGLFLVLRQQFSRQLDQSLSAATLELARATISGRRIAADDSALVDATGAVAIPERKLYLLDARGQPLVPGNADAWIREYAVAAARTGTAWGQRETDDDRTLRLEARRFRTSGRTLVAVAVADQLELEDRYIDLILAFTTAGLAAVVLVAFGGGVLTRQSIAPIEGTMENMRRFMADAAHELKTPIAIVRTTADVALQRARDEAGYTSALRSIEEQSRRLGGIVDNLLTLSRADAGGRRPEMQPVYLDDIAADCLSAARVMSEQGGVTFAVADFHETAVNADPALVRDLILILLDNAIKFTPRGGKVTLSVAMTDGRPTLAVADTGAGISQQDLPHVFQRFYRGHADREKHGGAGLGLSIAKWITDEHRAVISVRSERGKGTIVSAVFQARELVPTQS